MIVKIIVLLIVGLAIIFLLNYLIRQSFQKGAKNIDEIYNLQDGVHRIFQKIVSNQSDSSLIWNISSVLLEKVDPKHSVKREIEKEIILTYTQLQEAAINAEQHGSQDALAYIAECEHELSVIKSNINCISSVSEIVKQLHQIKEDARLIAEQSSFDDGNDDSNSTFGSQRTDALTYYEILGISKTASKEEIKNAYKKLALIYHPDKYSHLADEYKEDAEKKFRQINEAYQILSNKEKRENYDKTI